MRINEGGRVGRVMSRMIHQGIGIDYQTFSGKGQFINMICIRTENSQQQNVFSLESLSFSKLLQNNIIINSNMLSKNKYYVCKIIKTLASKDCKIFPWFDSDSLFSLKTDFLDTFYNSILLQGRDIYSELISSFI